MKVGQYVVRKPQHRDGWLWDDEVVEIIGFSPFLSLQLKDCVAGLVKYWDKDLFDLYKFQKGMRVVRKPGFRGGRWPVGDTEVVIESVTRGGYLRVVNDTGWTAWAPQHFNVAAACEWRCFHCDSVFSSREDAQEHFGKESLADPACTVEAARLRVLEAEVEKLRLENGINDWYEALYKSLTRDLDLQFGTSSVAAIKDSVTGDRMAQEERINQLTHIAIARGARVTWDLDKGKFVDTAPTLEQRRRRRQRLSWDMESC